MSPLAKNKNISTIGKLPDNFLALQRHFVMLRPIHNKTDYRKAVKIAGDLAARESLTRTQLDYLQSLVTTIAVYENERFEGGDNDPIDILKFLLKENNMTGSDLGNILGQRQLGSKLLRRERGLSQNHIKKIADHFSVSPSLFL